LTDGKKAVLIIDDDKSVLRTFSRVLAKCGYEVETAETGKEALEKISKKPYDVALIDFRLPDMDGTELLSKAKNQQRTTVKIMITGLPSLATGNKALDEGADAYLVKPVKPEELMALIEEKLKAKIS
jgi:DNA-binding response OmpR family regulator